MIAVGSIYCSQRLVEYTAQKIVSKFRLGPSVIWDDSRSGNLVVGCFWFFASSLGTINDENWHGRIFSENPQIWEKWLKVPKNEVFGTFWKIDDHMWYHLKFRMYTLAFLVVLRRLDQKIFIFLADFAFWLQSICEKRHFYCFLWS